MKLYSLILAALFLCFGASSLKAQIVHIPDYNFRSRLLNHGYSVFGNGIGIIDSNADGQIQVSEANSYSGEIFISQVNITDLTGLEAFTNISTLRCVGSGLSSLDVSANTQLASLYCGYNNLTSLDVSSNSNLSILECQLNQLTVIGYDTNNLDFIVCDDNLITSIDFLLVGSLQSISCDNNSITSIDLTGSTLQSLSCKNNPITTIIASNGLGVSNGLGALYCDNTQITDLDLSGVGWNFLILTCSNNNLSQLNIANGNNPVLFTFDATGNPNLSCITASDVNWCTNNLTVADGEIDTNVVFSANCFTNITTTNKVQNIEIYPNPTQKTLTVNLGEIYSSVTINISNTIGQRIQALNYKNTQMMDLEIEGLAGWYFIQIETEKGSETIKVLKQ